jgi:transposase InsO family protein
MAERYLAMDQKLVAALGGLFTQTDTTVTSVCGELGISRDSYYRYKRRFGEDGIEGLLRRSTRPVSSPNQTPPQMAALIVATHRELRDEGWDAGARSIGARLRRRSLLPPSDRTIHRVLVRAGLVVPQPRKRPRSSYRRFEAARPNQMWQLDGTAWPLADGTLVCILRLQDDHSRQIMATRAAVNENSIDAWECMLTAMTRHGAPAAVLTDGGSAFSARRTRGGLSDFEALLLAHGVALIVSSPHHPQTCGKKEREWSTCKRWLTARHPATDIPMLQRQLDAYETLFNTERPHQGIAGATPHARYTATAKAEPATGPIRPALRCTRHKVTANGVIELGNHYRAHIGAEWAHTYLDVIRDDLDIIICHHDHIVTRLRINPNRHYQPSGRPPGPRPLPSDKS